MKKKQLIKYIVDHVHTYIYIYIITVREGNNIHNLGKGKIVVLLFISILLFRFLFSYIHSCKYVRGLSNVSDGGNRIKICKGGKFAMVSKKKEHRKSTICSIQWIHTNRVIALSNTERDHRSTSSTLRYATSSLLVSSSSNKISKSESSGNVETSAVTS